MSLLNFALKCAMLMLKFESKSKKIFHDRNNFAAPSSHYSTRQSGLKL